MHVPESGRIILSRMVAPFSFFAQIGAHSNDFRMLAQTDQVRFRSHEAGWN